MQSPPVSALQGLKVLDLTRVLAGPWCTQTLADLGADVVKVERPGAGDDTRGWGPPFLKDDAGQDTHEAAYYLGANRNKRSITCDIATPAGQEIIRQLAQHADVFVENYKVGDMARYGLDYASLQALNPRLVYCSITGFGQTGPYQDRAGYDYAIQGLGGLMSVTGERDDAGGDPQKVGVAVADLFTGMYACTAVLAALRHAEHTGIGQHIDMALLDTQVAMLANLGANYLVSGTVPGRMGNAHQNIVPYQVFEVSDGHIIIAVGNDSQYYKFCSCLRREDLGSDPKYLKNQDRVRNRAELVPEIAKAMKTRSRDEWLRVLEAAKVPCGPINNLAQVFADPQVLSRGMVDHWQHPLRKDLSLVASPLRLSATPVRTERAPPLLGEHTQEVLQEWLNFSEAHVAQLRSTGVT